MVKAKKTEWLLWSIICTVLSVAFVIANVQDQPKNYVLAWGITGVMIFCAVGFMMSYLYEVLKARRKKIV